MGLHGSSLNGVHLNLGCMFMIPRYTSIYFNPLIEGVGFHSLNYTAGVGLRGMKHSLGYQNFKLKYLIPTGYSLKAVYFTPYKTTRSASWGELK